ncbi:heme exporter protein A [Pseudoxanthobacter soli DSM 19599]|uniref:Heme exporter protein A n=2 Tax=Pseudoxanthobacter TaxID=433838 RepID=A0A1M7ZFI0_9HYPH|nr:heme ABC exporter ATP-binding protein CcmA [Pseudoxanthobacter soli]SHO63660.1 heme exporter protein A [Pseudoxanthobacter soli DSM 19599]
MSGSAALPAVSALAVRDVGVVRGGRRVLDGVDFRLAAGQAMAVTGENGAGKSTLLRAIAGLVPIAGGRVALEGSGLDDGPAARAMHYVGHLDALKPGLTVAETLRFWACFLGSPHDGRHRRVEEALDSLDLAPLADLPAGLLSAGQRRRLAFARLVAVPRPVWLMDEPTAALDAASAARLGALMAGHLGRGGIVVAATHDNLPGVDPLRLDLPGDAA